MSQKEEKEEKLFWEAVICALLTMVDAIERWRLRRTPRTAELKKLGKRYLNVQQKGGRKLTNEKGGNSH